MAIKDGIVFRTAINGFHREDVNRYIMQQNRDFDLERQELREEISSLKKDLKKAADAAERTAAEKETPAENKSASREAELAQEAEALKAQLDSVLAEKAALTEKISQLEQQLAKTNPTEEKAKLYDEISAQVGDVIIQAKKSASDLIADAQKEADGYKQTVSNFVNEKIETFNVQMRTLSDQCLADIKKQFEEIIESSTSLLNDLSVKNDLISDCVEKYSDKMRDSFRCDDAAVSTEKDA